jgi:hypothetical protein
MNVCWPTSCPERLRREVIPRHFIPLKQQGETVDSMERHNHQLELEDTLKNWLRSTIARLERERAQKNAHWLSELAIGLAR